VKVSNSRSKSETSPSHPAWWTDAIGYEIYLRSFADGDGDGIGDLSGLLQRLDYVSALGVDLLWITPFYPSPMADFGYDVADYTNVNPLYGDLALFDELVEAAHERNIRVVADIVPNHSSSEHAWFLDALTGPDAAHRDHYIWADPAADGGPPNNWVGYFGGPAWTLDEASGQYYLHLFLPEQPDLNWANPAVVDAFEDILRFWLDRGIDGFRIDVAQALAKDPQLRSNPQLSPWDPESTRGEQWDAFDHIHDVLQPAAHEIYRRWNSVVEPYDALLLGETYVADATQLAALVPGDGIHVGFWFDPMHIEWSAKQVRDSIHAPLVALDDPRRVGWVTASADEPRPASRFGGGDLGRSRSLALTTLLFGLPGLPVLYQGEELGLVDGVVPNDRRADPVGADVTLSRDGCRTPMPWTPGKNFGFSSADRTWLPDGGRTEADTAAAQVDDPDSWFARYRALIETRKNEPSLRAVDFEWIDGLSDDLVAFRRGNIVVAANLGSAHHPLAGISGDVLFASDQSPSTGPPTSVDGPVLAPAAAIIIRT
jgi:alpha-glucosidase